MIAAEVTDEIATPVRRRVRQLVLVASPDQALVDQLVADVERAGSVACRTQTTSGCLRVATAVGPDVVLLDAHMSARLEEMLRSHPATARTIIVRLPIAASQSIARDRR
jgi:hypothetical protein